MILERLRAARRMFAASERWRGVDARWFFQSPSVVDRRFRRDANVRVDPDRNGHQIVWINGRQYVWPGNMAVDPLLQVVSELENPSHPNQYLWGPTTVRREDVVIDVGSCEGSFAAAVAELGAHPIAVEPSPRMQHVIRRLFEVRGLPQPRIVGCLLGRETGHLPFLEDDANVGHSRVTTTTRASTVAVEVRTLDDVVEELKLDRCDFIKCDAEGADVDIVMGATRTLTRFRPTLAICTYHADDHYVRLRSHLLQLGYQVRGKGFLHAAGNLRVVMLHAWWPH